MTVRIPFLSLLGILIVTAVTSTAAPEQADVTGIEFALYFAPAPKTDPEPVLAALLKEEFPDLARLATVRHKWTDIEKYAPPSPAAFRYSTKGLRMEQGAAIAQSTRVLVLGFEASPTNLLPVNREACTLVARLAEATEGLPWDEECRLLYSREVWRKARVESWQGDIPDVREHVNMHAYRNPELVRMITLGMRKFDLPDLVLTEVPSSNTLPAGNLMNAVAQRLIEGQKPEGGRFELVLAEIRHDATRKSMLKNPQPGATGRLQIKPAVATAEKGDPGNRLWSLSFPDAAGSSTLERQAAALASLYGAEDKVTNRRSGDAELQAASEKARKAFYAAEPAFRNGLDPNERVLVKKAFKIGDETEYMWIEIVRWNPTSVEGVLLNDSRFDDTLREGRKVTVNLKDVYDYLHQKPDGGSVGNETGKVLNRSRDQ
ncbi:MAG: hypothetical protein K0R17_230 [Rariglobus sp.]|jgi:uncharacterized protein YegJ (DUF2314 family)|nr:hypothetical protein [Rariglobus sp.]